MTHTRAIFTMILATLLWSVAGVVTRHLDVLSQPGRGFELTFWRSCFAALSLSVALSWQCERSPVREILAAPWPVWVSGACWMVIFTAYMLAMSLTKVANVLLVMALGPLITALFASLFLRQKLQFRNWAAIGAAALGIGWMFSTGVAVDGAAWGCTVAMAIPLAMATNWTVLQHAHQQRSRPVVEDMLTAVQIGATLSSLATLPFAWPLAAPWRDVASLALLGAVQLALPCWLVVCVARVLPAHEMSLLSILELLFGVAWAWAFAAETPDANTLLGGAMVLSALLANELGARAMAR